MEIGIWENVTKTQEKHKDGHFLYTARCKFCGFKVKCKLRDLGRAKICRHITNRIENKRINYIFNKMKYRCYNEKEKSFKTYGGKGIIICDEWLESPKSFEEWSIANGYNENLTIDRIDCDGNYCPENCRWISKLDNSRYKSTTIIIDVDGERKTGRQWANYFNIKTSKINEYRNKYGYENTVEFIRRALKYGIPKLNHGESYYKKLMQD